MSHTKGLFSCFQKILFLILVTSLTIFLTHCGSPGSSPSSLYDLAFDREGNNFAVMFSAPGGLSGPPTDIRKMKELLEDPDQEYGFKVSTLDNATQSNILTMTKEAAKNADTLLWYFSGHGAEDGSIAAEDNLFKFSMISSAIKEVRTRPLKRLIAIVDICYAGNLVNGTTPIIDEPDAETGPSGETKSSFQEQSEEQAELLVDNIFDSFDTNIKGYDKTLYEQAFVIVSSRKDETSNDLGAEEGGEFTKALRESWKTLKDTNREKATIRNLAETTAKATSGHHPVYRAYPSKAVLDDLLFQVTFVDPAKKLFALLAEPRSNGEASLYVSASETNIKSIRLCKDIEATCKAKLAEDVAFKQLGVAIINDRVVFKSEFPLAINENDSFTILGLDKDGKLVSSLPLVFENINGGN